MTSVIKRTYPMWLLMGVWVYMQEKIFLGGVANFLPLVTFRGLYLTSVTSDNKMMQIYIWVILSNIVLYIHTKYYVHWCCKIGIMSFLKNNSLISFSKNHTNCYLGNPNNNWTQCPDPNGFPGVKWGWIQNN